MNGQSPYKFSPVAGQAESLGEASKRFENEVYVAHVYPPENAPGFPCRVIHISFSRKDRGAVTDWRDKQFMKNQLVGAECEAVELFPAESRKVDGANQFHLFVLESNKIRYPFGFQERMVADTSLLPGLSQRAGSGATEEDKENSLREEKKFLNSPAGWKYLDFMERKAKQ